MKDKSKFRMIADQFRYMIQSGEMLSGEKFPTRKELCEKFRISSMTAFHVQEELQNDGLIINTPGIGFFVNAPEMSQDNDFNTELKKIRMIGSPQAIGKEAEFGSAVVSGAKDACKRHNIDFNLELIQVLNNPARIINTTRRLARDEALLVLLHSELLPEIITLLMAPEVRSVTVLRNFPEKSAVLPDWKHAAKTFSDYLQKRNAKKVLYVGMCSRWDFPQHETELFENFSEYADFFELENNFSGNFREVEKHVSIYKPDAILFSHSDAAVHFFDNHLARFNGKIPLMLGYGHAVVPGKEKLLDAVYYHDAFEMGEKAVNLLLQHKNGFRVPLWQRVKGQLIEYNLK